MTNEAILGILDNLCNEARNSMHAVFGLLELPGNPAPDSIWQSRLEIGRDSADRMLRVIDDARELLGNPAVAPEDSGEFDLSVSLRETVELLKLAGGGDGCPVFLNAGALPVRQNRHAVEQVLIRVMNVARKVAGEGGVTIDGAVSPDGFGFTIGLSDAAAAAEHLACWLNTDPDRARFPNATDVPLMIAAMVAGKRIRALGGRVDAAGEENAREGLMVSLPMAAAVPAGSGESPQHHQLRPDSLNVLIVEDCDDSYALSELLLRNESLWRARNGREALELVRQRRFDVVFMDVHMPGIDGYAAIRGIREWETETGNARTPVIVLSSDDLETQRRSAAQSGCSGFLRKPLHNGELLEVLNRLKAARSVIDPGLSDFGR
jgi:CheY-like chemotaxis protein